MALEVSRTEFQSLANDKLAAAKALLAASSWPSAYYLAGYAIEHALKACIAKTFKAETLPDKGLVNDTYQHDLVKLVSIAGLKADLDLKLQGNAAFVTNWLIVNKWSEKSRYTTNTEGDAKALVSAIEDQQNGVLAWIAANW